MKYEAGKAKIESFIDLHAWQEAHKLALMIYKTTKNFPSEEQFGLTSQIRRAAVSISSNIAEGFSRITGTDKRHFYTMAKGSAAELQSQLLLARDLKYILVNEFKRLADQSVVAHKLLTGLIKSVESGKGAKQ